MDREAEVIHEQMEETRESLAKKLETLETQVAGAVENVTGTVEAVSQTVEQVKEAVAGTVETVKESVTGTVETVKETVKETFDITGHVRRHPWVGLGGAVAVGFASSLLLERLLPRRSSGRRADRRRPLGGVPSLSTLAEPGRPNGRRAPEPDVAPPPAGSFAPAPAPGPGMLDSVASTFGSEISKLKGLAVGTALGMVRDFVTRSAPDALRSQLREVIDNVTTKLGGNVLQGPILEPCEADETAAEHRAGPSHRPDGSRVS